MSFSDDGWGSDTDDVKVVEPKVDVVKSEIAPSPPVQAQFAPEQPQVAAKIVQEPIGNFNNQVVKPEQTEKPKVADDDITLDCESDDGWGKDTPMKKNDTVTKVEPKTGRALLLPPAVKVPEPVMDSNITYDETLDFAQPPEMTSPCDTVQRKFVLPPKVFKDFDETEVKVPVGPPSLKPAGFGGDSGRVPLAEIGTEFPTKPTFGRQLPGPTVTEESAPDKPLTTVNSTLKSSGFGNSNKTNGFGTNETAKDMSNDVSIDKPSGFGSSSTRSFGGGFSGAPPKPTGFAEGSAGFAGGWIRPKAKTGFGQSEQKTSGFGSEKSSGGWGNASSSKPSGFNQTETKSTAGFGGSKTTSGFGGSETKTSGFGKSSAKTFGSEHGSEKSTGWGNNSTKPSAFGGPKDSRQSEAQQSSFGQSSVKSFGSGFGSEKSTDGWGNTAPKSSGFGGAKSTSGFGQPDTKPSGFGQTSVKSFGSEKSASGWGNTESKPTSGFGQSETKSAGSGFGSEKSAGGWGNSDSKPSGFGQPKSTGGFGQADSKPSGFGQSSVKSFGSEKSAGGWGNTNSKPSGSSQSGKTPGFGSENPSSGWGNKESKPSGFNQAETKPAVGFGQSSKSSGFGSEKSDDWSKNDSKPSGFGGSSKGTGFGGDSGKSSGWGQSDSKPSGFGSSESSKTTGFGSVQKSSGFGSTDTKPSGFGSSGSSSKPSGFGGSEKSGGWGNSKPSSEGFGANPSSGGFGASSQTSKQSQGFGADTKQSGFGSSGGFGKSSGSGGFGENQKQSGFGGSTTGGFGSDRNKGGGFGSSSDTGFGNNAKSAGFGASGGFGSGGGGFGSGSGGFGSGGDTGFGNVRNSGGNDGGDRKFACFNCGSEDHRKDECPEPPKPRTCHNCGGEDHISKECDSPRVPTGACRNCGEEGHFSRDCLKPKVPHGPCRNCQQEGHFYKDCTNERVFVEPTEPCRRCGDEGHWAFDCPSLPRDLAGNVLVPYDVQFVPEADMFNDAVNNDDRIDFDQKVFASIGNASVPDYASFDEFKMLAQGLTNNLKRMKMNRPTPIQRAAFFPVLNGNDVVACAHTGSGKTLAFLIPFATKLIDDMANYDGVRDDKPSPGLLIVSPTRELASQTFNTARQLTYETGLKCGIAYGGYSRNANLQHLRSFDKLNILVATMGRLQDFLESKDISLDKLKYVVLDEADRMVDSNDFGQEVANVIGSPQERTAQTVLFSASFSESLQREDLPKFVKEGYTMLQVDKFGTANEKIEQTILMVPRSEKRTELCKLLGLDENTCSVKEDARILKEKTLIFVNSVKFTDSLASFLCNSGIQTIGMHSYQNQEIRDRTLDDFRRGKYMCMVASNVAARGLNISGLDHVINYDMPDLKGFDEYVNRIGRTGRAGFTGAATAFVDEESDREIIPSLVNILVEAKKEVPSWLTEINDQQDQYNNDDGEDGW